MEKKKPAPGPDPEMIERSKNEYLWRCGLVALEAAIGQLATLAPDLETVAMVLETEAVLLREHR